MAEGKDWWDKIDVVGKIVSGVLLAVVALLLQQYTGQIQKSADDKAEKIKKGELIQSLVSDLSQPNERIRRDVALIALNRSIGDDDSKMVLEIVEHIFKNTPGESSDEALSIAYQIIKERNPNLAEEIVRQQVAKLENTETRKSIRSEPDISASSESVQLQKDESQIKETSPLRESQISERVMRMIDKPMRTVDARQISAVFPKIVYIQFQGNITRDRAEELRSLLAQKGISAPGVERVAGNYQSSVRYFNKEDAALAADTAQMVNNFFAQKNCAAKFEPKEFSKFTTPKGQIEVWINLSCPGS